jgi:thiosulfate dehydrogenase [quinone] large subunit
MAGIKGAWRWSPTQTVKEGAQMSALRRSALPIGVISALLLAYLVNPWASPDGDLRTAVTILFWITFVVLLAALFEDRKAPAAQEVEVQEPAFVRYLFSNTRAGLFWLPIRLFLGFEWLEAGWHKLSPTDAQGVTHYFAGTGWLDGGSSLLKFWQGAVVIPDQGRPPISFEWYREFLNFLIANHAQSWFAWLIVFGEIAVGVGLLLGVLTGIAAFFGAFMNMSFLLAGSASVNPVLFTLAVGVMLAWKVAGYYGLDRYLLPALGTPWKPGVLISRRGAEPATT